MVYNFEKNGIALRQKLESDFDFAVLTKDNRIIFSTNNEVFVVWDIKKDKLEVFHKFNEKHTIFSATLETNGSPDENEDYQKNIEHIINKDDKTDNKQAMIISNDSDIICFRNTKNNKVMVWDLEKDKQFTIELNNGGFFHINRQKTYAICHNTKDRSVSIFDMSDWKQIKELKTEAGYRFPEFSSCGGFILLTNNDNQQLDLYDIKKDIMHIESKYVEEYGTGPIFYDMFCAFKPKDNTLLIYHYQDTQEIEIAVDGKITKFIINSDMISVSFGKQTNIYALKDLKFKKIGEKKKETGGFGCLIL